MSEPILVQIIGAPIARQEGVKDSWREITNKSAGAGHGLCYTGETEYS